MHANIGVALKPNFIPGCRVMYLSKYEFSSFTLRILNLHNKSPKIFAIHMFGLKCLNPICYVKAVQDVISSKPNRV